MSINNIFTINDSYKTKHWWIFLSTFCLIFLPLIFFWIFYGEFNFSHCNWLIGKNQSVWHGLVTKQNVKKISYQLGKFYEKGQIGLENELSNKIGTYQEIFSHTLVFNYLILFPLLSEIVLAIIYPIIFKILKISGLDIIPFSFTFAIGLNTLILTSLIPHNSYSLLIRLFLFFFSLLFSFIFSNFVVNKILLSFPNHPNLFFCYSTYNQKDNNCFIELNQKINSLKKGNEKDKTFVEIKEK